MRLEERTEGGTRFLAPDLPPVKGPMSRSPVFFNPGMEFNRDVSIMVLGGLLATRWGDRRPVLVDLLAATGVRGLRFARELPGVSRVVINEGNPEAVAVIRKGVELNALGDLVEVTNMDARHLVAGRAFDYLDIDPYGSPATQHSHQRRRPESAHGRTHTHGLTTSS